MISERSTQLTRRSAVVALLQCGIFAQAFGCRQLAAGPFQTDSQPLVAAVGRLVDAMAFLGEPFSDADKARLLAAGSQKTAGEAVAEIERVLDPHCLVSVRINPESRVSVERGAAPARLVEQGWRAFLMKVRNEAGVTGVLNAESPQARPVYRPGTGSPLAPQSVLPADIADRWLALTNHGAKPMEPQLSGLPLEYRIVLLYSRDRGRREAQIGATLGAGTSDIGFRNRTAVLFDIAESRDVTLRVRDENGRPTTASFVIQDKSRPCLSRAVEAARTGFLLPEPDLPRRRRDRASAGWRVHSDVRARARVRSRDAHRYDRRLERRRSTLRSALDRSRQPGLVLRRPSHPRGRVQPLRESDRRRAARGHDAPRARRGAQRRHRS